MNKISTTEGYVLMCAQMIVNCASTLTFKWQSKITVDGGTFTHPFMQTMTMFFGEAICYLIFLAFRYFRQKEYKEELKKAEANNLETQISTYIVIIPTLCDLVTSCFAFFALQLMPSSVYQMVRGATIVMTAIFQVIFLHKMPTKPEMLGMAMIIIGNAIVGITVFLQTAEGSWKMMVGVVFLICSFITFSTQLIIEEKYFKKYYLNPFELVGLEGGWGMIFTSILLLILQFIPCPDSIKDECPVNGKGDAYFEQTNIYFQKLFDFSANYQPQLILSVLGGSFTILFLNSIGMAVIKYLSALTRNVVQVTTIALVWIVSILVGWESFYWGQLVGFVILVNGSLVYNKIIKVPCFNSKVDPSLLDNQTVQQQ